MWLSKRHGAFLWIGVTSLLSFTDLSMAAVPVGKLEEVRSQRLKIEKDLLSSSQSQQTTQAQMNRLKALQKIHQTEKQLTEKRLKDLERYLIELSTRKDEVSRRLQSSKGLLEKKLSRLIHPLLKSKEQWVKEESQSELSQRLERYWFSKAILQDLKGLEAIQVDLNDVVGIESRIEQEKQQIQSLMEDMNEQESILRFHQKIREELTQEKHQEHLRQLQEYQRLKVSEVEIERKLLQFQERKRTEREEDQKWGVRRTELRAKSLSWPVKGKVVATFGPSQDSKTGLRLFHKGIEISPLANDSEVLSILPGVVQFVGEIPGKGLTLILEHDQGVYSVYGGLARARFNIGDRVEKVDSPIAELGGAPLYFEIRARNVALDPLKWLR